MENSKEHIDELIARCLSGNTSEPDKAELGLWRASNADNEKYYQDVAFIYEATAQVTNSFEVDANKAWNKLAGEIKKDSTPIVKLESTRNTPKAFLRIAAVIIFLLGITTVLFFELKKNPSQTLSIVANQKDILQTLPDGSIVTVKSNSSLVAMQGDNTKAREYKLKGEAKFNVIHNEAEPFIIHADKVLIKDIGTVFDVKDNDEQDSIMVRVESGSVNFFSNSQKGIILKAGEKGVYSKSRDLFSKLVQEDVNKFGEIHFENATLLEVSEKLEAIYGVHIRFDNQHIASCRMTVTFNHSNPVEMIDIIKQTFSLQSKTENNIVTLYGKGCE